MHFWGRRGTSGGKTSDVETGDIRTSNRKISLLKCVDTIKFTHILSLRGLGTSHVLDCPPPHLLQLHDLPQLPNLP